MAGHIGNITVLSMPGWRDMFAVATVITEVAFTRLFDILTRILDGASYEILRRFSR